MMAQEESSIVVISQESGIAKKGLPSSIYMNAQEKATQHVDLS